MSADSMFPEEIKQIEEPPVNRYTGELFAGKAFIRLAGLVQWIVAEGAVQCRYMIWIALFARTVVSSVKH